MIPDPLFLTLTLLLVSTSPPAAQLPAPEVEVAASRSTESPSEGLRVFVDPETGQIRSTPTEEQLRALTALQRAGRPAFKSQRALEEFVIPGFGRAVRLDDSYLSSVVAVPGDEGLELRCTQHVDPLSPRSVERSAAPPTPADPPPGPVPGLETRDQ